MTVIGSVHTVCLVRSAVTPNEGLSELYRFWGATSPFVERGKTAKSLSTAKSLGHAPLQVFGLGMGEKQKGLVP